MFIFGEPDGDANGDEADRNRFGVLELEGVRTRVDSRPSIPAGAKFSHVPIITYYYTGVPSDFLSIFSYLFILVFLSVYEYT